MNDLNFIIIFIEIFVGLIAIGTCIAITTYFIAQIEAIVQKQNIKIDHVAQLTIRDTKLFVDEQTDTIAEEVDKIKEGVGVLRGKILLLEAWFMNQQFISEEDQSTEET